MNRPFTPRSHHHALITAAAMLLGSAAMAAHGQATPGADSPPPPPPADAEPATQPARSLEGTVESFNFNPGGDIDSLMLATGEGKSSQINFPPHAFAMIGKAAAIGTKVTISAEQRRGEADHAVFELISITGSDGTPINLPRPGDARPAHVEGKVKRMNFARDGRVNGVVLDNDTFVHLGPATVEKLKVQVGQTLTIDGDQKTGPSGTTVIDATSVNGTAVERPKPRPGGPKGPGDEKARPPRPPR